MEDEKDKDAFAIRVLQMVENASYEKITHGIPNIVHLKSFSFHSVFPRRSGNTFICARVNSLPSVEIVIFVHAAFAEHLQWGTSSVKTCPGRERTFNPEKLMHTHAHSCNSCMTNAEYTASFRGAGNKQHLSFLREEWIASK